MCRYEERIASFGRIVTLSGRSLFHVESYVETFITSVAALLFFLFGKFAWYYQERRSLNRQVRSCIVHLKFSQSHIHLLFKSFVKAIIIQDWTRFFLVPGYPEGLRASTKAFLFRFKKKTGQAPEEVVHGLDQVYKMIVWSNQRGPIFGYEELALSPDMRQVHTNELILYTNALSPTKETFLLKEKNVSLHAIEILTTGGESIYDLK